MFKLRSRAVANEPRDAIAICYHFRYTKYQWSVPSTLQARQH